VEKVVFSLRGLPIVFQRSKMAKVELGEEIKRNPQGLENIEKSRMMTFDYALRGNPFAFGAKCELMAKRR
jgi:hypothetical protein